MNLTLTIRFLVILIFAFLGNSMGQNAKTIRGVVLQDGTKFRVEQVEVRNQSRGVMVYSDKFGFFELIAKIGDTLQIDRSGYQSTKLAVINRSDLVISIKLTNQLKEVVVKSQSISESFREIGRAYSKEKGIFYGGRPPLNLLLTMQGEPITFFYELLSKDGRRVRRLNQLAKRAAAIEEIDRYFNDMIIRQVVPIDSADLETFKLKYTPKIETLRSWSEYQRATYIKTSFKEFNSGT